MKAALLLAERFGWAIVPLHGLRPDGGCTCAKGLACTSAGKHPRLSEWTSEATDDAGMISEWWRLRPDSNVGVATGEASGFFVLDVDPDKGGDDSLAELVERHGPLPATTQAVTGSGGAHYLFTLPGFPVTNSAGKVGLGLDIRGDGGQIVVAPSRSAKGQYRWVRPPWETPPAPAPAWLLAALGRAPERTGPTGPDTRGYFPAASAAVLDEARAALARHGPAIDGQGGGLHTVRAGMLLTHDYALTDDEAWPLLDEWNDTCVPPWELEELRAQALAKGRKYGKADYGCRRTLDIVETARKWIADWQAAGTGEMGMLALLERVRPLLAKVDVTRHALVERELTAASGLKGKALGLPKPSGPAAPPPPLKQGEIKVSTDLHRVADESTAAIAPLVFARNGALVQVVKAERTYIHELEPAGIQDLMSRAAVFVRNDKEQGVVSVVAPGPVASILHARRTHQSVRVLEAVTTAPVFLADGSILRERGYNAQARVYLEPDVTVDVPDEPTREDARRALAVLRDLVCDFRFATPADFSSWLAALLSPLVKAAIGNAPTPLTCISAAVAGTGKTMLAHIIGRIITGADADTRTYNPKDPAEWGKRLTAFVKSGAPVNLFDDVNGPIGDESLDRLITASAWADRQLGASEAPPLPVVGTWIACGNNIEPQGATVRRSLMVRLNVLEDRPEERTGFRHGSEPHVYAGQHRATYLGAALTLLRAYHCAGRPDMRLASWGSFGAWSALVRGALVWAGCADPHETQRRAARELNNADHEAHDFWLDVVKNSDGTPGGIVLLANQRQARSVLGTKDELTTHGLRRFLSRFVDKPRQGRRLRRNQSESGALTYSVESLSP